MRHIISMLMQNEAGALVRVAGMFSQRGFNIESLNVAPTEDDTVSRLTLVTTGSDDVVDQINRQLLKLVDVIDVLDMTGGEHVESELVMMKVAGDDRLAEQARAAGAEVLDARDGLFTLRFVGGESAVRDLIDSMSGVGTLRELVRSGAVAITPGDLGLRYEQEQ
ncbi:acetolactate synthase small subunit [Spectribacter hydrogenoxidans]|uniref:Acetolactate synthase small subunit n=1 Tax=Spectribacter hydrogenoxidans TaxID=3075608 RepID=A0ABU3BY10_9GAMM|nr:acetolactate synthase small subunit [Salinisphaera sp. W335]MDT0634150.1 acetolactate synthase small subunit [Salinisphaera sp. W335]